MALFFRAEAGEAQQGRSAAVQGMYRAAAAAAMRCPGGDELYQLLIASNVLRVLVDGGTPFKVLVDGGTPFKVLVDGGTPFKVLVDGGTPFKVLVDGGTPFKVDGGTPFKAGQGLQLLHWSVSAKAQLKAWFGYGIVAPRVKTLIAAARKEAQQQASGSGGSSSSGDVTIVNADVRALLQPQEEGLLLRPHPARASHYMQSVTPVEPPPKPCGNCGKYFHSLLRCKACQSVAYCGRDCQLAHWKAHKQQCKQVQQEKEAAAAAKADKAKRAQR
ncbi:hypothetical protein OEZ85_010195 [Tetradesmus obliquus]|uniref:MYND-type domain-containing protein n=1 Tax=Tetradesmus obliquus TaxID=3088 RepID=A0ABY8TNP9_TETOB|nr:hypothetical protein OEZ85_010195 [Tetradesmus obliquus]